MTSDDIIRMAREAGFSDASQLELNVEWTCVESEIKHFANLVAAAERKACIDACNQVDLIGADECIAAIKAEREACANILDEMAANDRLSNYFQVAAIAIRARGKQ